MNRIKLGIIGVGNMGRNHVRVARNLKELFDLTAVFDPDSEQVARLGLESIAVSSELELIERVDAVIVAAPSSMHKRIGLLAAEHGLHVLMEKPLALAEADAKELVEAFDEAGTVLMVDHVERFNPVVLELGKLLEREEVVGVEIERCSPQDRRISDTDVVYDLMIHDVDILMNAILPNSECEDMVAFGKNVYSDGYADYVQALFRFDNGSIASVIASRTTESKIRSIRVHCKSGFIEADLLNRSLSITRKTRYTLDVGYSPLYSQENIIERVFVPNEEPLRASQIEFFDAIEEDRAAKTDGLSSLRSLHMLDSIKECVYGKSI